MTFSYTTVFNLIGLPGTQTVNINKKVENNRVTFCAREMSDSSLENLIERVRTSWFEAQDDDDDGGADYQAKYAYACGYYD